jgi:hypothetical protein
MVLGLEWSDFDGLGFFEIKVLEGFDIVVCIGGGWGFGICGMVAELFLCVSLEQLSRRP